MTKRQIDKLEKSIKQTYKENMQMLDDLKAAVAERNTVDASVKTLLKLLADKVASTPADKQAIAELAAAIRQSATDLSTAVTENTPAA